MKSMTLFIEDRSSRLVRQPPATVALDGAALALELFEMGPDILRCRRHERGRETIIDGFDDRRHGVPSSLERVDHLRFSQSAVFEIAPQQGIRVWNLRSMCREKARRRQRQQPF